MQKPPRQRQLSYGSIGDGVGISAAVILEVAIGPSSSGFHNHSQPQRSQQRPPVFIRTAGQHLMSSCVS